MFKNYSITLGESFRDVVEEAISDHGLSFCENESFKRGYLLALHRVFTLMTQSADDYNVPLEIISVESLTEEHFLL